MAILRAVLAFVLLTLGGFNGLLAGSVETCTGNAPDSLMLFPITLALNTIGMLLLCWRPNRLAAGLAAAIPTLLALNYSSTAFLLATGTPACTIITGDPQWGLSGEEAFLAGGWGACALIFWIGLAYALSGGYRPAHDRNAEDYT